jgi:hypothetical protein
MGRPAGRVDARTARRPATDLLQLPYLASINAMTVRLGTDLGDQDLIRAALPPCPRTDRGHPMPSATAQETAKLNGKPMTNDQGLVAVTGDQASDLLLLLVAPTGFEPALPP